MKLFSSLTPRLITAGCLGVALALAVPASAKLGKGKGKGPAKVKSAPHKVVTKTPKIKGGPAAVAGRGASAFAPGRSANPPPGHGGIPPGQLKKAANAAALSAGVQRYLDIPSSSYALNYGNGYAGRGYYWGPPGVDYFHEAPLVRYFADRNLVPNEFLRSRFVGAADPLNADVQAALAQRGYYHGPVDGAIGPRSRAAISRFQADQGLPITGQIDSPTLGALGIY